MLTEAEAKTRWCPFARVKQLTTVRDTDRGVHDHSTVAVNRDKDGSIVESVCCIGSACMAWRGTVDQHEYRGGADKPEGDDWEACEISKHVPFDGARYYTVAESVWRRPSRVSLGYCGLAGAQP
jgi:hypothetical protein